MKYRFQTEDYRLFRADPIFVLTKVDFVANLIGFLVDLGIKPDEVSRPVANCLYERMQRKAHYRTQVRILALIQTYQELLDLGLIKPLDPVQELALWFHDAVYLPQSSDNQEFSADFAVGLLSPWMQETSTLRRLICRLTPEYHIEECVDQDIGVLLDLLLSPLALPTKSFKHIQSLVRHDFPGSDNDFLHAQYEFLTKLTEKKKLFRTQGFEGMEPVARTNIEGYLLELCYCGL